jgi:hypothetical protein
MAPAQTTQISAHISETTSADLERYVDARGLKKGYVIEQALRHYLRALHELPADAIVPPQLLVSTETAEHLADRMAQPRKPTAAMLSLFSKK